MARSKGLVTLMIIRDTEAGPTSIRLSRTLWRLLIFAAVVFVLVFILESVTYFSLLADARERDALLEENTQLKGYTAKMQMLEKELRTNRLMLHKMTELAGIDMSAFSVDESAMAVDTGSIVTIAEDDSRLPHADDEPHAVPQGYPVSGWISRTFRPQHENPKMRHWGIDIAVAEGTDVLATADGRVSMADWDSTFGWTVVLDHGDSLQTMYGHNDSLLVHVGDNVHYGQRIALSGSTGISSAPHLHYEVRRDGKAVDPEQYLATDQ